MHQLMMNLPVVGTLGVVALLAGPLARLPIVAGAWLLERCLYDGRWNEHSGRELGDPRCPRDSIEKYQSIR